MEPEPKKRKKSKTKSALARSMEALRAEGYIVAKTERWNPFAGKRVNGKPVGIRQDLFGFIDLLALPRADNAPGILAVQVVNTHLVEHITKIRENEAAKAWLGCGQIIVVHHWRQRSKNKVKFWDLEVIEVTE